VEILCPGLFGHLNLKNLKTFSKTPSFSSPAFSLPATVFLINLSWVGKRSFQLCLNWLRQRADGRLVQF